MPCPLSLHWASLMTQPLSCQSYRSSACPHAGSALQVDPSGHRGSCCPQPSPGEDGYTNRPKPPLPRPQSLWGQVEIFSRSRSSQPRESGKPHSPPGCLPSAAERGPGGLSCCVPGITGYGPHRAASPWGPTGRAEQGCWTAQQPLRLVALLKQFKLQSEMPGSLAHRAW